MSLPARVTLWIVFSAAFTLAVIQYSLHHGRLILHPSYDDVSYFADGLARLQVLYREGPPGLFAEHVRNPPHSPFATYLALLSFALFGARDWAPYAGNAIIVFTLLAFVDYLLRSQGPGVRVALAVFALTVPFAGEAVEEFRPDIACGLLTAMAVVLLLERPLASTSLARRRLAGGCLGLALFVKPTIFPLTIVLLAVSMILRTHLDRLHSVEGPASRSVWSNWRPVLWPLTLLGLPHFLLTGRYYLAYFHTALLDPHKPIDDFHGTLPEKLGYYIFGQGGEIMLGQHWILLAAIIVVGGGFLAMRRGADGLRPLLYQLAPLTVAYAVPTMNPVKQYFFGIAFAVLLFFMAVEVLAHVLDALEGWARLRQVLVTSLLLASLLCAKSPPYWGEVKDPLVQKRNRLVEEIYRSLREAQPRHDARIYVTTAGTVNAHLLQYMALKDGFSRWSFGKFDERYDLELYRNEVKSADFVVASEPGNSEVPPNLASTALQGQTLALLRDRQGLVELATFPTLSGKSYVLFERIGAFFGWAATDGFLGDEGPYPQWSLPIVRWGLGPSSRLQVRDTRGGSSTLVLEGRSDLRNQVMIVRLDGNEIARYHFTEPGKFETITIVLPLAPGSHNIELAYRVWQEQPNEPRRAVLFKTLRIVPDQ